MTLSLLESFRRNRIAAKTAAAIAVATPIGVTVAALPVNPAIGQTVKPPAAKPAPIVVDPRPLTRDECATIFVSAASVLTEFIEVEKNKIAKREIKPEESVAADVVFRMDLPNFLAPKASEAVAKTMQRVLFEGTFDTTSDDDLAKVKEVLDCSGNRRIGHSVPRTWISFEGIASASLQSEETNVSFNKLGIVLVTKKPPVPTASAPIPQRRGDAGSPVRFGIVPASAPAAAN